MDYGLPVPTIPPPLKEYFRKEKKINIRSLIYDGITLKNYLLLLLN